MAQVRLSQRQLQTLSRQLYGKTPQGESKKTSYTINSSSGVTTPIKTASSRDLRNDLLKIAGFSLVALIIQFIFFLGIQYQLIKF